MKSHPLLPTKLSKGDEIRIISPARSLSIISDSIRSIALKRLTEMGLKVSFSKYCEERDIFDSSSTESRLKDIHEAFADTRIKAILTTIGGCNSIHLLQGLNYKLIRENPKILCGYSDITTLQNAILTKTGLITFSGPHFSTFGCLQGVDYIIDYFQKCLFFNESVTIIASPTWSDDEWYQDQENRHFILNPGFTVIQPGFAKGSIIGGNIDCLTVLQGTEYMPTFEDRILFLEDNYPITAEILDRHLHSLILQKNFQKIKGIVIGRFQKASDISMDVLKAIFESKNELKSIPVIAGADFGHTMPLFTFPIGGIAEIKATSSTASLKIQSCVS